MPIHGQNIIAGDLAAENQKVYQATDPTNGDVLDGSFHFASDTELDAAVVTADLAAKEMRFLPASRRSALLRSMAREIEAIGDELIARCMSETGLPEGRLVGERGRTTNQLRMFADLVDEGSWVDARIDTADPDRTPVPKPDVRRMLISIGPVAVFCASNFPLAFSVAGGDTASAIAAGCGVVIKAHSSHPGTAEIVATALTRAIESEGMPKGAISLVHGSGRSIGTALVRHRLIKAVGFTGSRTGGRALFDAAASRPEPIPVYAEMGSSNPVFVLPGALASRSDAIAEGLKNSVILGAGQFCTNPGLVVGMKSTDMSRFIDRSGKLISEAAAAPMLNGRIHEAYVAAVERLKNSAGVSVEGESDGASSPNLGVPTILSTDASTFMANQSLASEVFGPSTLVVEGSTRESILEVAESMEGHLTATIHGTEEDLESFRDLVTILERKVGRIIFNGFPTGVEVCSSMNHGGPYPASSDSHFTSVGTAAIYRFTRPICYQGFPDAQLPPELQNSNPRSLYRIVNSGGGRDSL